MKRGRRRARGAIVASGIFAKDDGEEEEEESSGERANDEMPTSVGMKEENEGWLVGGWKKHEGGR